jgi:hypothetical protein
MANRKKYHSFRRIVSNRPKPYSGAAFTLRILHELK